MVTHRLLQPILFQHKLYLRVVALLLIGVCMTRDLPGVLLLITEALLHQITEDHHLITVAIRLITIREDLLIIEDQQIIEFRQTTGAKAIIEDPLITEGHQITEVLNQIIIGLILLMGIEAETQALL